MSKVSSFDLSELTGEQLEKLRQSELERSISSEYLHSQDEDDFQRHYCIAMDATNASRLYFFEGQPIAMMRAQVVSGALSYWGRPIKLLLRPHLETGVRLLLVEALKSDFLRLGISSASFLDEPFLLASLWSKRDKSGIGYRGLIDLRCTEQELLKSVRKSYRSLINWGRKNLVLSIFDHSNISEQLMERFRSFHIAVAGRETRSRETWNVQRSIVERNNGFILFANQGERLVSAILILMGTDIATYGVAVNDRNLMAENRPIGHWPLFHSILHAKSLGKTEFDLGLVWNEGMTEKEIEIAKFKKGFAQSLMAETRHSFQFSRD